jgi:hypothetical protein
MYGGSKTDHGLACMILDSSFCNLVQVAEELVDKVRNEQKLNIPGFVTSIALRTIEKTVQQKANFSIRDVSPVAHVTDCTIPAFFVAGLQDDFIAKHHTEHLYEKYGGKQHMLLVEGGHNDPRPKVMVDAATDFLKNYLEIPDDWAIPLPEDANLAYPPWHDMMVILSSTASSPARSRQTSRRQGAGSTYPRPTDGSSRRPVASRSPEPTEGDRMTAVRSPRPTEGASSTRRARSSKPAEGSASTRTIGSPKPGAQASSRRTARARRADKKDEKTENGTSDVVDRSPVEKETGFDSTEMGMTEERQNAIESSVAKILGGKGA